MEEKGCFVGRYNENTKGKYAVNYSKLSGSHIGLMKKRRERLLEKMNIPDNLTNEELKDYILFGILKKNK